MGNKFRPDNADKRTSGVTIGNVEGGIHGSKIAGRDIIDVVIQIVEQTGGQVPQARNLPAQLTALQQARPHLTHPAEKAATQAAIEKLEQAIAALPAHEQAHRERIKARYAEDAPTTPLWRVKLPRPVLSQPNPRPLARRAAWPRARAVSPASLSLKHPRSS